MYAKNHAFNDVINRIGKIMATNVQIKEGEKKKKNIDRSDDYLRYALDRAVFFLLF